jgi:NDP-sugar pyrophosphorylase family protein
MQLGSSLGKKLLIILRREKVKIVIAMAGKGSRTADQFSQPKPLIPILGIPLVVWALSGLPLEEASEIVLVINKEIAKRADLYEVILPFIPRNLNLSIHVIQEQTSGQAETVLLGTKSLKDEEALLIFNCDTLISDNFPENYRKVDGILGTFRSSDPQMSYVESNSEKVFRTAEKNVISDAASTGLYFFKSLKMFRYAYAHTRHLNESYVAPLYNVLIEKGMTIGAFTTDLVVPLGTSSQIISFDKTSPFHLLPKKYR